MDPNTLGKLSCLIINNPRLGELLRKINIVYIQYHFSEKLKNRSI